MFLCDVFCCVGTGNVVLFGYVEHSSYLENGTALIKSTWIIVIFIRIPRMIDEVSHIEINSFSFGQPDLSFKWGITCLLRTVFLHIIIFVHALLYSKTHSIHQDFVRIAYGTNNKINKEKKKTRTYVQTKYTYTTHITTLIRTWKIQQKKKWIKKRNKCAIFFVLRKISNLIV